MPARPAASPGRGAAGGRGEIPVLPVLLCPAPGGLLWPLSRQDFPDIFVALDDDRSAFDHACAAARAAGSGRAFVTIDEPHRFLVSEAAERHGLTAAILLAGGGLGELDAACLVALNALRSDAEAALALIPVGSRHEDPAALGRLVRDAAAGPAPSFLPLGGGVAVVRASVLLDLAAQAAPAALARCRQAFAAQTVDPPFVRPGHLRAEGAAMSLAALLAGAGVAGGPPEAATAAGVPSIDTVAAHHRAQAELIGCRDTVVHSPHRLTVAVGLDNVVIVDTPDALLVARRGALDPAEIERRIRGRPEQAAHRRALRPWGAFEAIDRGPGHQVKRITVKPGAALSLQYHHHRAEHWIVVRGTARVTCGDRSFVLHQNESTFIPMGAVHRLENPGKIPLEIIEVQSGAYLGEDDIVRIEDVYGRTDRDSRGSIPPGGQAAENDDAPPKR